MPENAGIQCDSAQIRVEQERSALEEELRQTQIRLNQVEELLLSLSSRQSSSGDVASTSREETDLVTSSPSPAQDSSLAHGSPQAQGSSPTSHSSPGQLLSFSPTEPSSPQSPLFPDSPTSPTSPATPLYSPSSDIPSTPPPVDHQHRFSATSVDPDIRARLQAQFPGVSTFTLYDTGRHERGQNLRRGTVSRSKRRRERRKRLRDARVANDPAPTQAAELVPEVKNDLGIISIRRKDFKPISVAEVKFITDNFEMYGTNIDVQNTVSIYKNTLRVFCDSKIKLQNVWASTKHIPALDDHPGFCFALPGIKFSDLRRIECRLPAEYYKFSRNPAPLLDQFLAGCPGFERTKVKFVRLTKIKSNTRAHFVLNKSIILVLDVADDLFTFIRAKSYMTKLDKKWRVKWKLSKREKEYKNKEYKKVENVVEYWDRKRYVSLVATRKVVNSCFDFRSFIN